MARQSPPGEALFRAFRSMSLEPVCLWLYIADGGKKKVVTCFTKLLCGLLGFGGGAKLRLAPAVIQGMAGLCSVPAASQRVAGIVLHASG